MELTEELKKYIDGLSHYDLLYKIRFAPAGDPYMQGEVGKYWIQVRNRKQAMDSEQAGMDSKAMEWDR